MPAFPASGQAPAIADGTVLRQACADFLLYYLYGSCIGYIAGVHDRYVSAPGDGPSICLPDDMTAEGRRDVVWAYLDDHPDRLDDSAESLVLRSLIAAFPCQ
jgi:hypothetical protein